MFKGERKEKNKNRK